jgi:hypothetical protein
MEVRAQSIRPLQPARRASASPCLCALSYTVLLCSAATSAATIGTLNVQTCVGTTCTTRFTQSGAQHTSVTHAWTQTSFTIPAGTTSVRWMGIRGTSFTGDISIDTILISTVVTPPSSALFTCNFPSTSTSSWCGMAHTGQWQLRTGQTGSSATGPSGGQGGSSDGYAYVAHHNQSRALATFNLLPGHVCASCV